ncbi:hypothetical protein B7463_g9896, partial [Scytalidium lignicola]
MCGLAYDIKAWESVWLPDLPTLSEFYDEHAEISAFSPPKQNTWKGMDAIKAHFKEIQPIISPKFFNVTNLDLVNDGNAFYAAWDAEFELRIPGQEGVMEGRGIIHCVRKDGKVGVWTMYEDPTPFVQMAMKGQMA